MTVSIDGVTLSRLLYSYLNASNNQYGLLLGEKTSHIEEGISDSQMHTSNVKSTFCVSSFLPWPSSKVIYSRNGCLNTEGLEELSATTTQDVIGWFSFRHKSVMRPSLREATLHKNLASGELFKGNKEDFLFFLCSSSSTSNLSTFTCKHAFMQIKGRRFVESPVTVLNLGDTVRKEYRKHSNVTLTHCDTVNDLMHKARKQFVQSSTGKMDQVCRMNSMTSSLNKCLEDIHRDLVQSEAAVGLLEAEVDVLRRRLRRLEEAEMGDLLLAETDRADTSRTRVERGEDRSDDREEEEEMNRLLRDLGFTIKEETERKGVTLRELSQADGLSYQVADNVGLEDSSTRQCINADSITNGEQLQLEGLQKKDLSERGNECENKETNDTESSICGDATSSHNDVCKTYSKQTPKDKAIKDPFDFINDELHNHKPKSGSDQTCNTKVGRVLKVNETSTSSNNAGATVDDSDPDLTNGYRSDNEDVNGVHRSKYFNDPPTHSDSLYTFSSSPTF